MFKQNLALAAGGTAITGIALATAPSNRTTAEIAQPANASTLFLAVADGRIAYDDAGHGPLAVLVPGLGDLRQEYRFLTQRLVSAGYRVVTMDIRGHGESSVGWPDYSSSAIGRDLIALVRSLNAGPAVLIGTSMGAGAVASAAADAPEEVAALTVIGPFVRDIPRKSWLKWLGQQAMIRATFAGPWAPAAWGAYYATLYPTAKPADFDAYKARLVAGLKEPGRMAALKAMMFAQKSDVESRLARVRAPTLVVMGTKDPDFDDPAEEARTVAGLLRGSVMMVEGAGHYPQAEMPDTVAPVIIDFLNRRAGS